MPAKLALLALLFALTIGGATAQPNPKKLVTKTYKIKSLIGESGKASGLVDADAVIKLIFQSIPQLRELRADDDGPQIIERDGGKLDIRATEARHEEIKDLLTALEQLQDLAIDVPADVLELDAEGYAKLVKALPKGKTKPPVLLATGEEFEENFDKKDAALVKALEEMNKILKAGRTVQTSSERFVNGAEAAVSARRTVVTFSNARVAEALGAKTTNPDPQFVKEGFSLVAVPVVSADRRFVRFKLTEQSTVISGVKKRDFGEIAGQKVVLQTPETEDLGSTGSATVADGGTLIFKLAYAPKDKVWVVVLHPTIFIQTEEDILKKEGKKP